jgi:hypothetical protein
VSISREVDRALERRERLVAATQGLEREPTLHEHPRVFIRGRAQELE